MTADERVQWYEHAVRELARRTKVSVDTVRTEYPPDRLRDLVAALALRGIWI